MNKVLLYHFLLYKTYTVTVKTNNKSWFTSSQVHLNKTTETKKGKQNKKTVSPSLAPITR